MIETGNRIEPIDVIALRAIAAAPGLRSRSRTSPPTVALSVPLPALEDQAHRIVIRLDYAGLVKRCGHHRVTHRGS